MNSTPVNCAVIMRVTALLPPPPRQMTLILAACGASSPSNSGRRPRSLSMSPPSRVVTNRVGRAAWRRGRRLLEDFTEPARESVRDATEQMVLRARRRRARDGGPAGTVKRKTDPGGGDRPLHHVREAADGARPAAANGQTETGCGHVGET